MSKFQTILTMHHLYKVLILLFCCGGEFVLAQQPRSFKAICNTKEVSVGEQFEVSFRLTGARIKDLQIPNLKDFEVYGPSTSVSTSYINGLSSQVESHTYVLVATKPGKINIGAATVVANTGETFKSDPFSIQVVGQKSGNKNIVSKSQGAPDLNDKVLLKLIPSNNNPVVGEQVSIDLVVYTLIDIAQINFAKFPKPSSGAMHQIDNVDNPSKLEMINGKEYVSKVLSRLVIFPEKAGELIIDAGMVNIAIYDNNSFTSVFSPFSSTINYRIASNDLKLNVKALSNMPKNFDGTIGDYVMQAHAEANTLTSDDVLRLIVKVRGAGDLKQMGVPKLLFDDNAYEVFPPNIKEELVTGARLFGGMKTFEFMLTPLKVGHYPIRVNFTSYNTTLHDYHVQDTLINIEILQGKNPLRNLSKVDSTSTVNAENNETIIVETLPALSQASLIHYSPTFFGKWWFWLLIVLAPSVAIFAQKVKAKQARTVAENPSKKDNKKAVKENTIQQLQKASSLMQKGDAQAFYTEVSHALKTFISFKTEIPFPNLNKQNLSTGLAHKGVDNTLIEEIQNVLNTCDMALYAGLGSNEDMQKIYQKSSTIISTLNKIIA